MHNHLDSTEDTLVSVPVLEQAHYTFSEYTRLERYITEEYLDKESTTRISEAKDHLDDSHHLLMSALDLLWAKCKKSRNEGLESLTWMKDRHKDTHVPTVFRSFLKYFYHFQTITGKDGSCLFRSSAVIQNPELVHSKDQDNVVKTLRNTIAENMQNSPGNFFNFVEIDKLKDCMTREEKKDHYFLEDQANRMELQNPVNDTNSFVAYSVRFFRYCDALKTREDDVNLWGGYAEVMAISQHFGCTVYVIRLDDPGLSVDEEGMLIPSDLYRIGEHREESENTQKPTTKLMRLMYDPTVKHYEAIMESPAPPPPPPPEEPASPPPEEPPKKTSFTYESIYNMIEDVAERLQVSKSMLDIYKIQVTREENYNEAFMTEMKTKIEEQHDRFENISSVIVVIKKCLVLSTSDDTILQDDGNEGVKFYVLHVIANLDTNSEDDAIFRLETQTAHLMEESNRVLECVCQFFVGVPKRKPSKENPPSVSLLAGKKLKQEIDSE